MSPGWVKIGIRSAFRPVMKSLKRKILFLIVTYAAAAPGGGVRADPRALECGGKRIEAVAAEASATTSLRLADGSEIKLASVVGPGAVDGDDAAEARALAALKQLSYGKKLVVFAGDDKDRYGRIPARAVLVENNIWLEASLVEQGLLRVLPGANEACVRALLAIEHKARAEHAGLWSNKKFQVMAATDVTALTDAIGRFVVVEGVIRRAGETKPRLYLDFGWRFTEDFTIVVPNPVRNSLVAKGLDPKNWRGKRVRVRGVLISWGGPAIEINVPAALEFVDSIPEKSE